MVRVTFWLQLLLLVLVLKRSAADCDQCGELRNEISSFKQNMLTRLTELEHRNEIVEHLQSKQRFLNCHIETGKQTQAYIFGLTGTEGSNKQELEELLEKQKQLQATIDVQRKTEETNNRTIQELREKQKQLLDTIDHQTKIQKSNNQTIQELRQKHKQLQANINGQTKTVEAMKQNAHLVCGKLKDACRYLFEAAKSGDLNGTKRWLFWTNDSCTKDDQFLDKPLIIATVMGHVEVVRVLLEGGTNVELTNVYQTTALDRAAFYGHLELCRLLLDWGAKVDPLDVGKNTPLHFAASKGHLSVVKLLVERGADVRLKNVDGKTARDMARLAGHCDVADWLDSVNRV